MSSAAVRQWPAPIDHVYILCDAAREPERAAYLHGWFAAHAIDPASYTMGLTCYGDTLTVADAYRVYNPWVNRKPVEQQRNFNSYNLKRGEISLCVNWAAAAAAAVVAGHDVVMFLESDVLFGDTFLADLGAALSTAPAAWDFLSLSEGPQLRPRRPVGSTGLAWFPAAGYYHTRTTDAMVFRVDMLKKIVGSFFPFAEVLDWELNYQLTLHRSQSFWLDPPIIRQGSGREYATTL